MKRCLPSSQKPKVTNNNNNNNNKSLTTENKQTKKLEGFEDGPSQAAREILSQPDMLAFQN